MSNAVRYAVAAIVLVFAWKDAITAVGWLPKSAPAVAAPAAELRALASPLRDVLPRMTPKDRAYLASFYEAVSEILANDGERDSPIISDTEKFAAFHAGSLRLAVKRADVGKYSGLGEAIDLVFAEAAGAEVQPLSPAVRNKLVAACGVLSWAFKIGRDQ